MFKKIYKELVLIRTDLIAIRKELQSIRKAKESVERKRGHIMVGIDWCGENESDFSTINGYKKNILQVVRNFRMQLGNIANPANINPGTFEQSFTQIIMIDRDRG